MIYKVILAHTAVDTYDAIFEQINAKFGIVAARKFEVKVIRTLRTLTKTPLIFKAIEEQSTVRKGFISKNCSFFYEVSESEVNILYFWDNRQEPLLS